MSAIDTYLKNNAEHVAEFSMGELPVAPAKRVTIVTCMDARIQTTALLSLAPGEAHVIRNAGGIVTDDVIRSITISQRLLGTREIMVIHHTGCGMLMFTDEELSEVIRKETGSRPPFELGAFSNLEDNVRQSLARIRSSPFVACRGAVRGFVYEVETGRLREVE